MRRHRTHKKNNRMTLYMGIFITLIMATSGFGVIFYGFSSNNSTEKYNGFKFKQTNYGYETKVDGKTYYFEVLPIETEHIEIEQGTINRLKDAYSIIITSDPFSSYRQDIALQTYQMNTVFANNQKQMVNAFTKDNVQLPTITCDNSTDEFLVVEFVEDNSTYIESDNCIRLHFQTAYEMRRATGRIIYEFLGVVDASKIQQ
ncbi:hypothetical protein H6503_02005 [Candidatus Woesearchaeota archaeon]|nr:hypothetical protein [Candidatus Woesearchaeota archaeon]